MGEEVGELSFSHANLPEKPFFNDDLKIFFIKFEFFLLVNANMNNWVHNFLKFGYKLIFLLSKL